MKRYSLLLTIIVSVYVFLGICGTTAWAWSSQKQSVELSATDGIGLRPKTKPVLNSNMGHLLNRCNVDCTSPFGGILGEADKVKGFSNCQSNCVHSKYSFLNLTTGEVTLHSSAPTDKSKHYIGLIYQCVEYARRWWMKNKRITFGDINSAYEIIYLAQGKNIDTNEAFKLGRSINGTATRAPKRGDLLVYYADPEKANWQYGHVAVVVGVDLDKGLISLAEQNYNNLPWPNAKTYSRQLPLFQVAGKYQVIDIDLSENQSSTANRKNASGGVIAGWVYPLEVE